MSQDGGRFLERLFHQRMMRRWARAARFAQKADLSVLRDQRGRARALKTHLDTLIHRAEDRLALPYVGARSFPKPYNADWAWRPDFWRGPLPRTGISSVGTKEQLGPEVTVFHDCPLREITLRQVRNLREEDLAPYGLRMEVFRFNGSFLSLVIDLPNSGLQGIKASHVYRLDAIIEMESPLELFARLNIKHGPNTEQIVRELPLNDKDVSVEFDLAYSDVNDKRVDKAWVDIIFEGPDMNQVTLRDLTFSRRPRAAL